MCRYYFVLKGLVTDTFDGNYLRRFETAVKSFAYEAPLKIMSVNAFEAASVTKMRRIQATRRNINAMRAISVNSSTQEGKEVPNRKRKADSHGGNADNTDERDKGVRSKRHSDLMKDLFSQQKAERVKPAEQMAALETDKNALLAEVKQLENELARTKAAVTNVEEIRLKFCNASEAKEKDLRQELEAASVSTKAKLQKARAFYNTQKELLELQVQSCSSRERDAIVMAFDEEYGELDQE